MRQLHTSALAAEDQSESSFPVFSLTPRPSYDSGTEEVKLDSGSNPAFRIKADVIIYVLYEVI